MEGKTITTFEFKKGALAVLNTFARYDPMNDRWVWERDGATHYAWVEREGKKWALKLSVAAGVKQ